MYIKQSEFISNYFPDYINVLFITFMEIHLQFWYQYVIFIRKWGFCCMYKTQTYFHYLHCIYTRRNSKFLDNFKHFEIKYEFCNIILTFCFNEKYSNKRIIILSIFIRIFQRTFKSSFKHLIWEFSNNQLQLSYKLKV